MPRTTRSQTAKPATPAGPRLVRKPVHIPSTPAAVTPQEQITIRAYELFLQDGGVHGRDVEHWLRAEQELLKPDTAEGPDKRVAGAQAKQ